MAGAEGFEPSIYGVKSRCVANFTTPLLFKLGASNRIRTGVSSLEGLPLYPLSYARLKRMAGVDPASQPWQGCVLPLNYIRMVERIGIEPMQLRAST